MDIKRIIQYRPILKEENINYMYLYNFRQKLNQFDEQRLHEGYFGQHDKDLRADRFHRIEAGTTYSSK